MTGSGAIPEEVAKLLLPHETGMVSVRQHPVVLLGPVAIAFGGMVAASLLSAVLIAAGGIALTIVWGGWLVTLAHLALRVFAWSEDRFIVTNQRMMMIEGIITHHVAMMPLGKVTDMSFQQSPGGRLLGYGTFVLESAGQDQAMREITHIPQPEHVYLQVCEMIFPDRS